MTVTPNGHIYAAGATKPFSFKHRQLYEVVVRHWFDGLAGLAPRAQAAGNHENLESFFDE
jgi:hypothetical protein